MLVHATRATDRKIGEIAFAAVALAPVLAVLAIPVLVLQDGALHLSAAAALGYQLTGDFADVLTWRPGVPPNLTAEIVLLGLLQVLPPTWALKVLVIAILVGFAFAARQVVVAAGATAPWAILLLPFAWHRLLALGFLGFSAAVALALLAIALVLARPADPPLARCAAVLTATWFTHLLPAIVASAVCVAVVVTGRLADRSGGDGDSTRAVARVLLAVVPVAILTVAFALDPPEESASQFGSPLRRAVGVLTMRTAAVSSVPAENMIYPIVALLLYGATAAILLARLRAPRRIRPVDALLVSALLGFAAAVFAPDGVSGAGGYLGVRAALFPPLLLAVWVAAHLGTPDRSWPRGRKVALVTALGAAALLLVVVRWPAQNSYSTMVAELTELAADLPEHSTVVQVTLDVARSPTQQLDPLADQVGLLTADRHGLDMGNESGWVPYYVWRYREDQRADRLLGTETGGLGSVPPRVDLDGALRRGLRLDAVVVVGRPTAQQQVLDDAPTRRTLADLAANYRLAATSSNGTAELWLRNPTSTSR